MKEIRDINILAIESSCDETAAAVIHNGREEKTECPENWHLSRKRFAV